MDFNTLYKHIIEADTRSTFTKLMDVIKTLIPEEYYTYMPFKKFREELKQRKQLHNSAESRKNKKFSEDDKPVPIDQVNDALDSILQKTARQKFAKWFETNIENKYKNISFNVSSTKSDTTLNNDFILFDSVFDDYYEPKLANNPKLVELATKYYFDTSSLDTKIFNFKKISNPDDTEFVNWTYSNSEFQRLISDTLNSMLKESSKDGALFNTVLTNCFTSIRDNKSRSLVDNIDFIILSNLLVTAFIPAYSNYGPIYKQKLTLLSRLIIDNKSSYYKLSGTINLDGSAAEDEESDSTASTSSAVDTDEDKLSARKIITAMTAIINKLSDHKSEFSAKMLQLFSGNKRIFDDQLKIANSTKPIELKNKAKTQFELVVKLYKLIEAESRIMERLAPKLIDLQKALDTMPKFIDKPTFERIQNNVISRIEKEEEETL